MQLFFAFFADGGEGGRREERNVYNFAIQSVFLLKYQLPYAGRAK